MNNKVKFVESLFSHAVQLDTVLGDFQDRIVKKDSIYYIFNIINSTLFIKGCTSNDIILAKENDNKNI